VDARFGEAQGRDPAAVEVEGPGDRREGGFAEGGVVADVLDGQEPSVGGEADLPQGGQVVEPFARSKMRLTRSGRPMSRLSRMTCSKKTRPDRGRSRTWVRENSACRIDRS
jgi:hypothetical protein